MDGEPALLPDGTVDAQADIDSILELQRSHGNRVVVQLIAAAGRTASIDMGGRADRLVKAIKFELPWWTIDVPTAAGALDGLGPNDVTALSREVERRLDISLLAIISKARISAAERKQLQTLMQGSGIDRFEGRDVREFGETAGTFVGNIAAALGADVDPELAGKVSGAVFEATARAAYEAERPEAAAAAATRRFYAQAHEIRTLMGKSDKERLFALIGGSHEDRMALADAYAKEYGTSLYNDLTTKLSGKEKDRFQALWAGDRVGAETAALEAETEQRKKAEAEAEKAGPLLKLMGSDAAAVLEGKSAEARAKQERRVESLATAGVLEDVLKRSGPKLEGVIEQDKVLGFLRRGNVPEVTAMRLVRADREGKLTQAMIEEALRTLRDEAELEAYQSVAELNLGPVVPLITPLFVSGYYKRFEQEFDWQSAGGTTLKGILANAASSTGIASWVADPVLAERNQALIANGGYLPPWQELDFALRAKPKDMKTVRRVLGDLTPAELGLDAVPREPSDASSEPTTVAAEYKRHTNRRLVDDLMGTSTEQQLGATLRGGEYTVELGEKRLWIGANRFVPSATDEAGQIAEEGRWRFGRIASYERLVMENRGSFAKARDFIGNLDKSLVSVARADAADAKGAMEQALLDHPPDLMEAARQVTELQLIEQRLEANIAAYKQGTAEAWDEFVSFVAEVVTAIGTGGTSVGMSIARKAVITAVKSALYTVGTKLVLDAENYSPAKLLADLRSAAGGALGSGLSERFVAPLAEDLAWSVSAWAAKRGLAPGLAGQATELIVKQEGDVFVGAITTALATGEGIEGIDPYSQLRGMAVSAGAGKIREGGEAVVKRVRRRRRGRRGDPDMGEGVEDIAPPTSPAGEAGAPQPGEPEPAATAAGPAADVEETAADIEAEMPPVSMALPEPKPRRSTAKPPPIPDAAKRRKPPEEFPEGPGPAEPDDFTSEPDTEPDVRPAGDFESEEDTQRDIHPPVLDPSRQSAKRKRATPPPLPEEVLDRIRKPGPRAQGDPDPFPPQDWDHQLVIQLHDATNHEASRNLLIEMFGQDPSREVGMYRNTVTGEYIVIQGEARTVGYVPKKGGIEQRWKEILEAHSEVGSWELVTHTHPQGTPFASGARGDFGVVVREGLNARAARSSEILFPRADGTGLGKTEFGFDPDGAQPYWIKPDGSDQTYTFATLPEYLKFVGVHESVPDWVPKGRVDWSKRGELLKAYERWNAERKAEARRAKVGQAQEGPSEPEQGVTTARGRARSDQPATKLGEATLLKRVGDPARPGDANAHAELQRRYEAQFGSMSTTEVVQQARARSGRPSWYMKDVLARQAAAGLRRPAPIAEYLSAGIPIDVLRDIAPFDRNAAEALIRRYRREYSQEQLERMAAGVPATAGKEAVAPDPTAREALAGPAQGPRMDADAEIRLIEGVWEARRLAIEPAERARREAEARGDKAAIAAATRALEKAQSKGTLAALETDIPGIERMVRGSPEAPATPEPRGVRQRYEPSGGQPTQAQSHAEQELLNLLRHRIDELRLKPRDLDGRTIRIAVDQEVCSVCAAGTGSEAARPGVLLQFANDYKGLTIEIVDIRTGHYLRFERGRLAESHRGMGREG